MRKSVARAVLIVSALSVIGPPADAQSKKKSGLNTAAPAAQEKKKGQKKPARASAATDIELDEPTPSPVRKAASAKGSKALNAPTAGAMSEQAENAKRLYDADKLWEAAIAYDAIAKGESGDDEGNRQVAQFGLAKTLYKLKFYQAAYSIFSAIAENPNHLKFNETLLWLAKLATDLPEPADIVEQIGKYDEAQISRFDNPEQRDLYWQLNYLLGRYQYRNRQYEAALQTLAKVGTKSKYYVKSQFFIGISYVQLRKSVPAVQAFQRILTAADEGAIDGGSARMHDLAALSMARTYYSASIRLDQNNAPTIDPARLSAAVKYWNMVGVGSEYWLDALFEESWAYFMAGDYPHALGNIHTLEAPYFPNAYFPEAQILRAVIYFSNCQYDDATTIVAQFQAKYQPFYDELASVMAPYRAENQEAKLFAFLQSVHDGNANLPPRVRPVVELALSDRQLLRGLEYVRVIDAESARLANAPANFQQAMVGVDTKDSLEFARNVAVRASAALVQSRYQRNLDDLGERLRDAAKILIDITAARRNQLDQALMGGQVTAAESKANIVRPDKEHVLWPFDGEYWRDELAFYRQTITSKCGR